MPLDSELKPATNLRPFYTEVAPKFPERESTGGNTSTISTPLNWSYTPSQEKVKDLFVEWFEDLDLPFKKSIVPLAHNWAFECSWLKEWLGVTLFDQIWFSHARNGMLLAISLNDRAAMRGEEIPFNGVGLGSLRNKFNVVNTCAHDALADAIAEAIRYTTPAGLRSRLPPTVRPSATIPKHCRWRLATIARPVQATPRRSNRTPFYSAS